MTGRRRPEPAGDDEAAVVRRQKLADALDEAVPQRGGDESPDAWGDRDDVQGDEEWLRGQVPPHHA